MVSTLKKTAMAAAVAGALCASLPAQAVQGIKFDPTGTSSPGVGLDVFNWVLDQILAQASFNTADGGILAVPNIKNVDGFLIGQGKLDSFALGGGPSTSAQTFTYEFKVPTKTTTSVFTTAGGGKVAQDISVAFADRATPDYGVDNYFRIYHTPVAPDAAAGTGYGTSLGEAPTAGQSLIFEGKIDVNASSKYTSSSSATSPIGTVGTLTDPTGDARVAITGGGSLSLNIEHCSASNVGSLAQCSATTFIDTRYFRSDVEGLTVDVNLGTQLTTPFAPGDLVPNKVVNQQPNFGGTLGGQVLDNISCEGGTTPCDMLYDGQNAKSNWFGNFVPEPGTVALLGLGLAGLGGFSRKSRSRPA